TGETRARAHRRRRHHDRPRGAGPAMDLPPDHAFRRDRRAPALAPAARDRRRAGRAPRRLVRSLWRRAGHAGRTQAHRLDGSRTAGRRRPAVPRQRHDRGTGAARCSERLFRETCRMNRSTNELHDAVKRSLERYFKDMDGEKPTAIYDMVLKNIEKPMIEMVLGHAEGNQSLAAEMLGINRNTLRKTLHPRIHAGLLARQDDPKHQSALAQAGIEPIELVVVNLYPFQATVSRAGCTLEDAVENIDIGGPAMLRAAAKNYGSVAAIVDPADYPRVLEELRTADRVSAETRYSLARKVFAHTAAYDAAVANYLTSLDDGKRGEYPEVLTLQFRKLQDLRYGENPHQSAAFYRDPQPLAGGLASYRQVQGKDLSYNNIADADAAWECVKQFDEPACVIIKHANPCGVAIGASLAAAYERAFATDPVSAF